MRRVQRKRTRLNANNVRLTHDQKALMTSIANCNQAITKIPEYNREHFILFFNECLGDVYSSLHRDCFTKKDHWRHYKGNEEAYMDSHIIKDSGEFVVNVPFKHFTIYGLQVLKDFYDDIQTDIKVETYLDKSSDDEEYELDLSRCFELMGLDDTISPSLASIKKAYRMKALILHPDKHPEEERAEYMNRFQELNRAYQQLCKRYGSS